MVLKVGAVLLAVCDSGVNQLRVLGLLGGGEDERRVGRRILGLVLLDGSEVTRVGDDSLQAKVLLDVTILPRVVAMAWG